MNSVMIVIPTIGKNYITYRDTQRYGLKAIIVHDIWKNVSRARNYGAFTYLNMDEIGTFVFMDDDLSFDEDFFYKNLDRVKDGTVIWMDPPFICFITKADFAKTGGFDERIKPSMGMESEFRYRLMILGIEIKDVVGGVRHFGGKSTKQKERWNQKNLTFTYLIYWKSWRKKLGLFKRKNPVEFGRRILWFLEWLIVFHIQKRSDFLR